MIKDLLVCLEGSQSSARALDLALELAPRLGATVTGLVIIDEPDILTAQATSIGGAAYKRGRDETLLHDAEKCAEDWIASFAARCRDAGVIANGCVRHGR